MGNWFNRPLKVPKIKQSLHDLSCDYKSSVDFGMLTPNYVEECVPSDKFVKLRSEIFLRFAPMKFPIMHRCKVRQNFFAVPYRLIMGDELYNKFLNDQIDIVPLVIVNQNANVNLTTADTVFDYLGYQPQTIINTGGTYTVPNPLALWSYVDTWCCWYADEVLDATAIQNWKAVIEAYRVALENQQPYTLYMSSQAELDAFALFPVSYTKDYFTAAQTEPQRGGDVYMMNPLSLARTDGTAMPSTYPSLLTNPSGALVNAGFTTIPLRTNDTIRDFWVREQLQRFRDVDALFGTTTPEKLAGHWHVISSDARIQLPQYIGGGEQIVQIQEVTQTSSDTATSPMASLAGKATSFGKTHKLSYFCEEHTMVIGFMSIVPDNGYMTGNPRYFFKKNIFDFASPEFNNLGYQAVYNGEIFSDGTSTDLAEFGYQMRYSEYRQHRNVATGKFRDASLMSWHMNRYFASLPPLNANFIHVNRADADRIFNVSSSEPHIYVDVWTESLMARPVSYMPSNRHLQ